MADRLFDFGGGRVGTSEACSGWVGTSDGEDWDERVGLRFGF